MPLELIYGPAGSGKTPVAIKEFMEAVDSGMRALFIAPSFPDARHFQRQVLAERPVLAGGNLTTFNKVFETLVEPDDLKVVTPFERLALLREAIKRSRPAKVLADSSIYEGFVKQLADLVSELDALDIDPARLGEAMKGWAGDDRWRRGLNQEFFRIHEEYRALLADLDAVSNEQAQRRAAESLLSNPGRLGADLVVIDGFKDFTSAEMIFVEAVGRSEARLLITLPYEEGRPAYTATGIVFSSLAEAAETKPLKEADSERMPALVHLSRHLFQEGASQVPADGALAVLKAAAVRGQGERVAAEILKLWRAGVALDDIAVVTRSHGADSIAIADACRDLGIPIEVAAPMPLASTPVGMTALAALGMLSEGEKSAGAGSSVLSYLRSPLADAATDLVDTCERQLSESGMSGAAATKRLWETATGRPLAEHDRLQQALPEGLPALAAELSSLLRDLLTGSSSKRPGLDDLTLDIMALKELTAVCKSVGALEDSLRVLREGIELKRSDEGAATEAIQLLAAAINQAEVRLPSGAKRGCVRLLDPHRMLNQRFDVVFICGLLEGQFPSARRENAFFTDADRIWLREHQGPALDTHQNWLEEERFLFHRTLTRARVKVYLCYPGCDQEGKPTVNSLLVDDVLDLFIPDTVERITSGIGDPAFSPAEAPTEDQALLALGLASHGQQIKVNAPAPVKQRFADCLAAARPRLFELSDEAKTQFQALEHFHVTELEEYLRCPFGYFIRRVVQAKPLDEDKFALERGNAVHKILKSFFSFLSRAVVFLPKADQDQVGEARRIMDQTIETELADKSGDLRGLVMKSHIKHHLDRFIDREIACRPQFRPYIHEESFGICNDETRGRIDEETMLSFGGVKVCGRIDRIDLMEGKTKAVVIDYKTSADYNLDGQGSFDKNAVLQVPLYMLAARDIWGLEPVGGEYYGVLGGKRRGLYLDEYNEALGYGPEEFNRSDFVDADEFEERLEQARERAVKAAEGIRAADFGYRPVDKQICSRCSMRDLCRVEESDSSRTTGSGEEEA